MTALIVDFDGVVADSFGPLYRLNARALRHAGLSLTEADYRAMFATNVHSALHRVVRNTAARGRVRRFKRAHFDACYRRVKLFSFAPPLVRRLSRRYDLAIVSASPQASVLAALERYGLTAHFTVVSGSSARSKATAIRRALAALDSRPRATGFITDTTGDIEVGRRLGVMTLAVSWGFHDASQLRQAEPTHVFTTPRHLLAYLDTRTIGR